MCHVYQKERSAMSTNVERRDQRAPVAVSEQQFGALATWLEAAAQPHSPLVTSDKVSIAEPLAYLPALKVLVQGPIYEEQTLSDLMRAALRSGTPDVMAALQDELRTTAVGLAEAAA
jgi:hypothetical protein